MIGWGIMAIAIGLIFSIRLKMMKDGSVYLARHGFILFRPYHYILVQNFKLFSESLPGYLKNMALVFVAAGIGVIAFNLMHLPDVLEQTRAGVVRLLEIAGRTAT